jgi:hypothetical protein
VARADVLNRELEDVIREFNQLTGLRLPAINGSLAGKRLEPIVVVSETEWQKQSEPQ